MVYNYNEKSANVITPEMLSEEQQGLAHEYIKLANANGIFVGALLGDKGWDVRPLVLDHSGASKIVRFSAPDNALNSDFVLEMYQQIPTYLGHLETGVVDNRVFQIRSFFQNTLADISFFQRSTLGIQPDELLLKLFEDCVKWRHKGFVHGHISLSNIAIMTGEPCLFDFAFAALAKDAALAPELVSGAEELRSASAADIYGLGQVAEALLGDGLSPEQRELVAAMQSSSPKNRPSLLDAAKILFPGSKFSSHNSVMALKFGDGDTLKLGKVLGTNLGVGNNEPQHQQEVVVNNSTSQTSVSSNSTGKIEGKKQGSLLPFAVLLLLIAVVYYVRQNQFAEVEEGIDEANVTVSVAEESFDDAWQSSIPSMMRPVAEAAVAGNQKARLTILKDVLSGAVKPNVQNDFLKVAFNPTWEQELNEQDRNVIFNIALVRFATSGKLPRFEELHPGVLYALIATLPSVNAKVAKLDDIPVSKLGSLPGQTGTVFKLLGQRNLTEPFVKAVARLLLGKTEPQTLTAYLTGVNDQREFVMRLSLLKELLGDPYPNEEIIATAKRIKGWPAEQLKWLAESTVFDEESLTNEFKLSFLLGSFTKDTDLKLEECADLLLLKGNEEVTALAAALLRKKYFKEDNKDTIIALLDPKLKLSRKQVVDFLSTISLDKKVQSKPFEKWFETKPDQNDVMRLVAARRNFELDPFNMAAVGYLKDKSWSVSNSDLAKLVTHNDMLVRVLVYSKLDPLNPLHLKLLLAGQKNDPSTSIRKRIKEKLSDYNIKA